MLVIVLSNIYDSFTACETDGSAVIENNLKTKYCTVKDFNGYGLDMGHRCIRKLFGLDSETCVIRKLARWIRKLFWVDSETFRLDSETLPVVFGNLCIRATWIWQLNRCLRKLFRVYSETCIRKLFRVDSETFPGGFGNFSGWIRKLVFRNFSGWIRRLFLVDSETFPGDFGNLYSETLSTE